ncbi:MAG: ABC transporter ATP-binding protein/permease [Clostridia bacterium]|nr:ABC transporter ATP-binding protein/permease [Clostridia bacterium]
MSGTDKKLNIFSILMKLLPIIFKAAPLLFVCAQLSSILLGLSWGVNTMFMQRFFDSATQMVQKNLGSSIAIQALLLLVLINFLSQVVNFASNLLPNMFAEKVNGKLTSKIHKKIGKLLPIDYEKTEILNHINKAEQGKNNAVWFILTFFVVVCFYIPYFVFMAVYLFHLKPILSVSIIIVFVPTASTQLIRSKVFSKFEDKAAPVRRENEYYESCIVGREYFKETRMLGAFPFFQVLFTDTLRLINKLRIQADVKTNLYELAMKLLTLIGYLMILYLLFYYLMKGEISAGAFAAVFNSIAALFSIMDEVVCGHCARISKNFTTIQNFLSLMDLPEREGKNTPISKNVDIHIENISFKYPVSETYALDNVSFSINNGETIAIVGENGSGKTTLVRLLLGLYLPDKGDILIGDANTKDYSMKSLFADVSAVFQKFQKYQMTLKENITISQISASTDESQLDAIIEMSGLDKKQETFPMGYDTMLSREFDGVDLSGGEWQRVAIARGLYRNHDLVVLDEPTSAIDPLEEYSIYNHFAKISREKTAIIVTHRLGSVKLADRIIVMDKGKLAEIGTHKELMASNGLYAKMFSSQEQWYSTEEV